MEVDARDRIFISYRRSDSRSICAAIRLRLVQEFGEDAVFQDVANLAPGVDFPAELRRRLSQATVVLAVIGTSWFSASDKWGRRRLDDEDDWVRLELEAALSSPAVTVIPLLLDGVELPSLDEAEEALPPGLHQLIHRQSWAIDPERLESTFEPIMRAIEHLGIIRTRISPDEPARFVGAVRLANRQTLPGHPSGGWACAWSPDGNVLATGGDRTVILWDTTDVHERKRLVGHTGFVFGLRWSHDGRLLASSADDGSVRIWDPTSESSQAVAVAQCDSERAWDCAWSADDQRLAIAHGSTCTVWHPATDRSEQVWTSGDKAHACDWGPDGSLAVADSGGRVSVFAPDGALRAEPHDHRGPVMSVRWSPDGNLLASAGHDGAVLIRDATSCALRHPSIEMWRRCLWAVEWSPDGRWLAVADGPLLDAEHENATGSAGSTRLFDVVKGEQQHMIHTSEFSRHCAWSPTGERLAVIAGGEPPTVYDVHGRQDG